MSSTRNLTNIVQQTISSLLANDNFVDKLMDKLVVRFNSRLDEQKAVYEGIIAEMSTEIKLFEDRLDQ